MFLFNKPKKIKIVVELDPEQDKQIYNNYLMINTFLNGEYTKEQIGKTFFANGLIIFMNEFLNIQADEVINRAEKDRIKKQYMQEEDVKSQKQNTPEITEEQLKDLFKRNHIEN